MMLFGCAVGFF